MISIIMFIFMLLIGFVFMICPKFKDIDFIGCILVVINSTFLFICVVMIIVSHLQADSVIQKNKMQYDGLCKRYEIVKSDYEDVSKSDVIADITAWNIGVYNTKYWTENPWTSWFNPKKIADNLDYISLEE